MIVRALIAKRREIAKRVPADQERAGREEGAEWLRGRRVTRKALMARRTQSGRYGIRWPLIAGANCGW